MGSFVKYKTKKKPIKYCREKRAQKVISVKHYWRLTMNTHTHTHTHNTPHARTTHIFVQQKCSKDLSGVCVWMFFFFFHFTPYTTRWRRRRLRRRRVYVGERVLLSHLYICRRNIGTLNSPAVLLKVKKVIYTSPSRPTMTPWK